MSVVVAKFVEEPGTHDRATEVPMVVPSPIGPVTIDQERDKIVADDGSVAVRVNVPPALKVASAPADRVVEPPLPPSPPSPPSPWSLPPAMAKTGLVFVSASTSCATSTPLPR